MTHDERVYYHEYVALKIPHENAERIASLEELVLEAQSCIDALCGIVENSPGCFMCPNNQDEDKACGSAVMFSRMKELGLVE